MGEQQDQQQEQEQQQGRDERRQGGVTGGGAAQARPGTTDEPAELGVGSLDDQQEAGGTGRQDS